MLICEICKKENKEDNNFCIYCGNKLKEKCSCWIKKQPYNCGKQKCPSYRLFKN